LLFSWAFSVKAFVAWKQDMSLVPLYVKITGMRIHCMPEWFAAQHAKRDLQCQPNTKARLDAVKKDNEARGATNSIAPLKSDESQKVSYSLSYNHHI